MIDRRRLLIGGGALVLAGAASRDAASIEATLAGGRIGYAWAPLAGGRVQGHRLDERFALCSTFKLGLAAAVLAGDDPAATVALSAEALVPHSPAVQAALDRGERTLSVAALARAIVTVSDNGAANLLLDRIGGPAGLTRFWRSIGDRTSRLDRYETALNSNLPGDPRDTTTPRAMIGQMRAILGGQVLPADRRDRLIGWLAESRTGLRRLRGGLPDGWRAGDKTGTGARGSANDVAIAWPPGEGPPILIACYVDAADASPDARDAAHRAVAGLAAR